MFHLIARLILLILAFSCSTAPKHQVDLYPGQLRADHEAWADKVMVSSQGANSTQAALKMIELGGNAVDAAVALSFAISVERPQSTGIGGGGFMLLWDKSMQEPVAVDFREKAPLKAHSKMYLDTKGNEIKRKSLDGIFAAGVPGLVAGVLSVHKKYGKLPLSIVMQPAINLANNGFEVYAHLQKAIAARFDVIRKFPASMKIFSKNGKPLVAGDLLVQKDLGKTLSLISQYGRDGFYKGYVAKKIIATSKKYRGLISYQDLISYNVKYRRPLTGRFRGRDIYSMPPPSSGGAHVVQILNILEGFDLKRFGFGHHRSVHLTAQAMQAAFYDRAKYMGDSDFVKVPVKGLTNKNYAKKLASQFNLQSARKLAELKNFNAWDYESDETTHFTIIDRQGMTVSSTQTINGWMGSGLVVEGTGILLNNEMDDFSTKPGASNLFGAIGSKQNLVSPQKRPLSSMSPTIIMSDKKPVLALGTPSGTRILTCVAQTILNYLEYDMDLYSAVASTRIHHQWSPDHLRIGAPYFSVDTMNKLKEMGHTISKKDLGCKIQAIAIENGKLHGVSDPRGTGLSKGI